jgi:quercetin dioxygenase-like cupin family protein
MELDDGEEVTLNAGDVLVQRGTIHNWVNKGTEICRVAFVILTAEPVDIGDGALDARG